MVGNWEKGEYKNLIMLNTYIYTFIVSIDKFGRFQTSQNVGNQLLNI